MRTFQEELAQVEEATQVDYPDQQSLEDHYEINLLNGFKKMQKYYDKLDDMGAYYAATVLNPHMKHFCKIIWKEHLLWLQKADTAFQILWGKYKSKAVLNQITSSTLVVPTLTVKERPYAGIDAYTEAYYYESNEEEGKAATLDKFQC